MCAEAARTHARLRATTAGDLGSHGLARARGQRGQESVLPSREETRARDPVPRATKPGHPRAHAATGSSSPSLVASGLP